MLTSKKQFEQLDEEYKNKVLTKMDSILEPVVYEGMNLSSGAGKSFKYVKPDLPKKFMLEPEHITEQ